MTILYKYIHVRGYLEASEQSRGVGGGMQMSERPPGLSLLWGSNKHRSACHVSFESFKCSRDYLENVISKGL